MPTSTSLITLASVLLALAATQLQLVAGVSDNGCMYNTPAGGQYFDLSPFTVLPGGTDYDYIQLGKSYYINVCNDSTYRCSDGNNGPALMIVAQHCVVLGKLDQRKFQLLDPNDASKGITMAYLGGAAGESITLNFPCDPVSTIRGLTSADAVKQSGMAYTAYFQPSKFACPISGTVGGSSASIGWILVVVGLVSTTLYCGGGFMYQSRKGKSGRDAIPNVEFWSEILPLAKDGCLFTYRKVARRNAGAYQEVA